MRAYRVILRVVFWVILSVVLVAASFWVYAIVTGGKSFEWDDVDGVPSQAQRTRRLGWSATNSWFVHRLLRRWAGSDRVSTPGGMT